jgi:hypothetical protein
LPDASSEARFIPAAIAGRASIIAMYRATFGYSSTLNPFFQTNEQQQQQW